MRNLIPRDRTSQRCHGPIANNNTQCTGEDLANPCKHVEIRCEGDVGEDDILLQRPISKEYKHQQQTEVFVTFSCTFTLSSTLQALRFDSFETLK